METKIVSGFGNGVPVENVKIFESNTEDISEIEAEASGKVSFDVDMVSVVNYALLTNGIPVVRNIVIKNDTDLPLENIEISIKSEPAVFIPYENRVDYVPEKKSFAIKKPKLKLNAEFLAGVTEKIKCDLSITCLSGGEKIAEEIFEVTALAFDEWYGYGLYPELLAAFVTPNHPVLVKILARASEFLKEWSGDASMDAYQTKDANRVLLQSAAIFNAVREENIVYAVPPASFENTGQRVRLCDAVLNQKFGTCLDLTLLYVSCLEAVGLHPIMIIQKGHIFSGVWLEELAFPEAVQHDASVVTKRLATGVNELCVVETTLAVNGQTATFDDAKEVGVKNLIGKEPVECIIDVFRARISGISPLPQRIHKDGEIVIVHDSINDDNNKAAPEEMIEKVNTDTENTKETNPKIIQWERKLLDLGLKNNLINLRPSKNLVPIITYDLDELEDALSDGSEFSVLYKPKEWTKLGSKVDFENICDMGEYKEVIKSEFSSRRLRSSLTETELNTVMKGLYRSAKASIEENGANTLYLALGILRWFETAKSSKPRYAPIVLVPVEIIRKSASRGFTIRLRDDEPQMNITILEKIKQDFGISVSGVDPLPYDEAGVDLRKVLTIVRKAIMEQPHWDVLESAYLGIFSFSQFVMWNDLRNRTGDLLENKVVKSLVDGKLSWDAVPMETGVFVSEEDVFLPMPADASQLYAIKAATKGKSFVLHGPPGTGKSQTITSLIANALANGKSVLFVAEKMAALDVVQKRLEKIGIGAFCLELHSNKSKKHDVLSQLKRALEVTKNASAEGFALKAEQISKLRSELDLYAKLLHETGPSGYTLRELINEYEKYEESEDVYSFTEEYAKSITRETVQKNCELIERLVESGKNIGHPAGHPLCDIGLKSYSINLRKEIPLKVAPYKEALLTTEENIKKFREAVCDIPVKKYADIVKISSVAEEILKWYSFPMEWAKEEEIEKLLADVSQMTKLFDEIAHKRGALLKDWDESFLEQDAEALLKEYNEISAQWFVPRMIAMNSFSKKFKAFAKGEVVKYQIGEYISELCDYRRKLMLANELYSKCSDKLGGHSVLTADGREKLLKLTDEALKSDKALKELINEPIRIKCCGNEEIKELLSEISASCEKTAQTKKECYELLLIAEKVSVDNWIEAEIKMCTGIIENADFVKEWITFNGIAGETEDIGLGALVADYRNQRAHEEVMPIYKKAMIIALISLALDACGELNTFSGVSFNEKINQYKKIDAELMELSKKEIYCRLASRIPDGVSDAEIGAEISILQKMIKSNGRGMSIRKLFEDIQNLLSRLCPCMLMSPISAAQYLDTKRDPFDIVVFDEASQLPTCKAVGVLARGKNAVIVGDPKQMPPTSFFAVNTVDEDNLEVEDLESILDDCLAVNMPQTHLLWHYRSRHESLIAFSNSRFYENRLYTFPSVNDRESKVTMVYTEGTFERGKSRTNKNEAEAVVNEIIRRSKDTALKGQSLGVVTFNISQQHLIDDLLSEACTKDIELEQWLYNSEEPLFIKNLENVQGDERDVILFSIGYGPDESGKVYMNFGPLNRDGGWRRLNVAVSRARQEMMVFTALKPEQISLTATSSEGVAALKAFLEYASGKEIPLDENTSEAKRCSGEGIIRTICKALKEHGYETDTSVGHSLYRVDIGVIDPDDNEKYILGIMLDGKGYMTAQSTRDREIAQINVLSGLGWDILRVWSMDWWDNKNKEIKRILDKLAALKKEKPEECDEASETMEEAAEEIAEAAGVETKADAEEMEETAEETEEETEEETVEETVEVVSEEKEETSENAEIQCGEENERLSDYSAVQLEKCDISAEELVSGAFDELLKGKIMQVINYEAPILKSCLVRKVVQSCNISRAGVRIFEYMNKLIDACEHKETSSFAETIIWHAEQNPESYSAMRRSNDENKREAKDVPSVEAENAICYVLEKQVSLIEDDLIREAAKLLGYTRVGNQVETLIRSAMESVSAKNLVIVDTNKRWSLAQKQNGEV